MKKQIKNAVTVNDARVHISSFTPITQLFLQKRILYLFSCVEIREHLHVQNV